MYLAFTICAQRRRKIDNALLDIKAYTLLVEQWSLDLDEEPSAYAMKQVRRKLASNLRTLVKVIKNHHSGYSWLEDAIVGFVDHFRDIGFRCPEIDPCLPDWSDILI